MVLTGNDLAIDMVVYGSDYLLGLAAFAPDLFAARDRLWAAGDPGFWELNDAPAAPRAPSPSATRCPATATTRPSSCTCGAGSTATSPTPTRTGARTATSRCWRPPSRRLEADDHRPGPAPDRRRRLPAHLDRARRRPPVRRRSVDPDGPLAAAARRRRAHGRQPVLRPARWRAGTATRRRPARPTSSGAAGGASARAGPSSSGAARRSPSATTAGPTPTSSSIGDDLAGAARRSWWTPTSSASARADDLVVGLQLTHSGRWSRPDGRPRPAPPTPTRSSTSGPRGEPFTDDELDDLVGDFVAAARTAAATPGFDFVDVKACHGYLGHELLSGVDRPGRYGGDLEGRIPVPPHGHRGASGRGARACDRRPPQRLRLRALRAGPDGVGEPDADPRPLPLRLRRRRHRPGHRPRPSRIALLDLLADLGVTLVCVTAGSPYYNPHVQRPAFFPPSDGYSPPEDPLVGVARLLGRRRRHQGGPARPHGRRHRLLVPPGVAAARGPGAPGRGRGRRRRPRPHGPELPRPAGRRPGRPAARHAARLCRTFSDCTTAPRNGLVSGCYPLDDFYKAPPERAELARVKKAQRPGRCGRDRPSDAGWPWWASASGWPTCSSFKAAAGPVRDRRRVRPGRRRWPTQTADGPPGRRGRRLRAGPRAGRPRHRQRVHPAAPPPRPVHRACSTAGKHVICEKPLVGSLRDVDVLAEAARPDRSRRLMPVYQYRYGAGVQRLRHLLDAGVAGRARARRPPRSPGGGGPSTTPAGGAGGPPSSAGPSSATPCTASTC